MNTAHSWHGLIAFLSIFIAIFLGFVSYLILETGGINSYAIALASGISGLLLFVFSIRYFVKSNKSTYKNQIDKLNQDKYHITTLRYTKDEWKTFLEGFSGDSLRKNRNSLIFTISVGLLILVMVLVSEDNNAPIAIVITFITLFITIILYYIRNKTKNVFSSDIVPELRITTQGILLGRKHLLSPFEPMDVKECMPDENWGMKCLCLKIKRRTTKNDFYQFLSFPIPKSRESEIEALKHLINQVLVVNNIVSINEKSENSKNFY